MKKNDFFEYLYELHLIYDINTIKMNKNDQYWIKKYNKSKKYIEKINELIMCVNGYNFEIKDDILSYLIKYFDENNYQNIIYENLLDELYIFIHFLYNQECKRIGFLTLKSFTELIINFTEKYDFTKPFKINDTYKLLKEYNIYMELTPEEFRKEILKAKKNHIIRFNNIYLSEVFIKNYNDNMRDKLNKYDMSYKTYKLLLEIEDPDRLLSTFNEFSNKLFQINKLKINKNKYNQFIKKHNIDPNMSYNSFIKICDEYKKDRQYDKFSYNLLRNNFCLDYEPQIADLYNLVK